MSFVLIGVNHRTAPVEVREQFAIPEARLAEAVRALAAYPGVEEAMIVSTCNRVELLARIADSCPGLDGFFRQFYGFDPAPYREHLYEYREQDAALLCHQCRLRYPVRDDIPIMLLDEATPI